MIGRFKNSINNIFNRQRSVYDLAIKSNEIRRNTRIGFHTPFYEPAELEFLHLPKCGGTSISSSLQKCPTYGGSYHRPMAYPDFIKIMSSQEYKTRYITVLRDPVSRVWSYYNMIKRNGHYSWGRYTKNIEIFLDNCWEVNNMTVQYFSQHIRSSSVDFSNYTTALKVLRKIYFVGQFENLNEDFPVLRNKILKDFQYDIEMIKFLNKAESYPSPTEEEVAMIRHRNLLDILLYDEMFKDR